MVNTQTQSLIIICLFFVSVPTSFYTVVTSYTISLQNFSLLQVTLVISFSHSILLAYCLQVSNSTRIWPLSLRIVSNTTGLLLSWWLEIPTKNVDLGTRWEVTHISRPDFWFPKYNQQNTKAAAKSAVQAIKHPSETHILYPGSHHQT